MEKAVIQNIRQMIQDMGDIPYVVHGDNERLFHGNIDSHYLIWNDAEEVLYAILPTPVGDYGPRGVETMDVVVAGYAELQYITIPMEADKLRKFIDLKAPAAMREPLKNAVAAFTKTNYLCKDNKPEDYRYSNINKYDQTLPEKDEEANK